MGAGLGQQAPSAAAVLVRLRAAEADWIARLPAVPGDSRPLTVTVGDARLADVLADELRRAGYLLAGVHATDAGGGPSVDVLVPAHLRTRHPGWWRRLGAQAERVFSLAHGPVLRVLADELRLHRAAGG